MRASRSLDTVGSEALHTIKDGSKIRLHDGVVYAGELELARGVEQDVESVADALVEAKEGLIHQIEAFAANTTEFMRQERALLLDGVGIPAVDVELAGRQVVVVAAGFDHATELARLKSFIREYRPVLVGVGAGADALRAAGHQPALIVGDPAEVSTEALTSGADIVVPAFNDGHAPGLHRVQDLGASAVTFPSTANAEDLALLLAAHHGASMIITVGLSATMTEFLDRGRSGSNASTFLTRLQVGGAVVDSRVIAALYRSRVSAGAVLLMVVAALAAVGAALFVSTAGDAVLAWLLPDLERSARDDQGLVGVISLRYHVVSMAAVFLALAVGVVLGAGGVSDRLLGAVNAKADDLTGQVQQLTAQRDALAASQRADDEFARRVAPAAVRGVLQGQSVAVVTAGADGPSRDSLVALIKQAGATVTGTVALTPAVTDPARADQLRQLTGTLLPAGAQLPAASDTGSLLGGLLGGVLTGPGGKAPVTGPQAAGVLSGLADGRVHGGRRRTGPGRARARAHRGRAHRCGRGRRRRRRHAHGRAARPRGRRRGAGGRRRFRRRHGPGRRREGRSHRHGGAVHRGRRAGRRRRDQHRVGPA